MRIRLKIQVKINKLTSKMIDKKFLRDFTFMKKYISYIYILKQILIIYYLLHFVYIK